MQFAGLQQSKVLCFRGHDFWRQCGLLNCILILHLGMSKVIEKSNESISQNPRVKCDEYCYPINWSDGWPRCWIVTTSLEHGFKNLFLFQKLSLNNSLLGRGVIYFQSMQVTNLLYLERISWIYGTKKIYATKKIWQCELSIFFNVANHYQIGYTLQQFYGPSTLSSFSLYCYFLKLKLLRAFLEN